MENIQKKINYDYTGLTFHRLTVIERCDDFVGKNGRRMDRWLCRCECGNITKVYGRNLRIGLTKSCGCLSKINHAYSNLEGQKFGKLLVIRKATSDERRSKGGIYWLCKCDCGRTTFVKASELNAGRKKSCGICSRSTFDLSGSFGIGFTSRGLPFYFDKDDFDLVKQYSWSIDRSGYVVTFIKDEHKNRYLHRMITGVDSGYDVDHINHCVNDNRKENLRICAHKDNSRNLALSKNNSSGYTGVYWNKNVQKWYATISPDGKTIPLGHFAVLEDAVRARQQAEKKYFGEFANQPKERNYESMTEQNMMLLQDFYKISHEKNMYPNGLNKLYATWTPRSNQHFPESQNVVFWGLQGFIKKYLLEWFDEYFFSRPLDDVLIEYRTYIHKTFDSEAPVGHIADLHQLGYLPLEIAALPEGSLVPYKVPCVVVTNTLPNFAWLVNFLETLFSCNMWLPSTTSTTAYLARKINEYYLDKTSDKGDSWKNSGVGDFSFRGMAGLDAAILSGAAFLTSFTKTSTIPAIKYLCDYYNADINKEIIGEWSASVEHSCTSINYAVDHNEETFFLKMVQSLYPHKSFSFVADTYNYWNFFDIIKKYKEDIKKHKVCIRIRPDSGDPEKILCGDPNGETEREQKGSLQLLWEIMGGTINSKGYKVLDPSIGLVYGDSITLQSHESICRHMADMGFAVENVVFGYGSYSMQYRTRDSQGWAYKITYAEINGQPVQVYKNPITSRGLKKSQKGMCFVTSNYALQDGYDCHSIPKKGNLLHPVFRNGKLLNETTLSEIRNRLHGGKF